MGWKIAGGGGDWPTQAPKGCTSKHWVSPWCQGLGFGSELCAFWEATRGHRLRNAAN